MADEFDTNLLRLIAAEMQLLVEMRLAREMFDKSYFALGGGEKLAADQAAIAHIAARYNTLTPEYLASHAARQQPIGFQPPPIPPTAPTTSASIDDPY